MKSHERPARSRGLGRGGLGRLVAATVVCITLSAPAHIARAQDHQASAEERAAARSLAEAGLKAFEAGDYAVSLERFQSAEDIFHAPPHLLYIARSQAKLGRLVEARDAYARIVEETLADDAPKAFAAAQADAAEEGPALDARIAHLTVIVDGDVSRVTAFTIGGKAMTLEELGSPIDVDPGQVSVELTPVTGKPSSATIELAEGATEQLRIKLNLAPAPNEEVPLEDEEGGSLIPGVVVLGVGVAGIGVGAVTGLMALGKASDLNDACPQNPCPTENQSLKDDAETFSTISTISFIAGGVLVAAGVTLLIIQPGGSDGADSASSSSRTARSVEIRLQPAGLSAVGRF